MTKADDELHHKLYDKPRATVDDGKVLKLTVALTEQYTQATEEHPGKLSIPLPLVTLNHEIRTPEQSVLAAHALRGLADLLDEQRGAKVDP